MTSCGDQGGCVCVLHFDFLLLLLWPLLFVWVPLWTHKPFNIVSVVADVIDAPLFISRQHTPFLNEDGKYLQLFTWEFLSHLLNRTGRKCQKIDTLGASLSQGIEGQVWDVLYNVSQRSQQNEPQLHSTVTCLLTYLILASYPFLSLLSHSWPLSPRISPHEPHTHSNPCSEAARRIQPKEVDTNSCYRRQTLRMRYQWERWASPTLAGWWLPLVWQSTGFLDFTYFGLRRASCGRRCTGLCSSSKAWKIWGLGN